jgi:F-type H+-transporting ATPase subunit b
MEILGKLGIDINLLVAQIVNFGLLLLILTKFVYKPIIKRIEDDERELKKAQEQSAHLEHEKKDFIVERGLEITKAKKRAKEIIQEAESISENIKKRTLQETEKEKQAVIKQIKVRLKEIKNDQNSDK